MYGIYGQFFTSDPAEALEISFNATFEFTDPDSGEPLSQPMTLSVANAAPNVSVISSHPYVALVQGNANQDNTSASAPTATDLGPGSPK